MAAMYRWRRLRKLILPFQRVLSNISIEITTRNRTWRLCTPIQLVSKLRLVGKADQLSSLMNRDQKLGQLVSHGYHKKLYVDTSRTVNFFQLVSYRVAIITWFLWMISTKGFYALVASILNGTVYIKYLLYRSFYWFNLNILHMMKRKPAHDWIKSNHRRSMGPSFSLTSIRVSIGIAKAKLAATSTFHHSAAATYVAGNSTF